MTYQRPGPEQLAFGTRVSEDGRLIMEKKMNEYEAFWAPVEGVKEVHYFGTTTRVFRTEQEEA